MRTGGNEPNANSIMLRLDYGSFSMMLAGDAEEQTEHRLITKELDLETRVLKVGHHGSRYATSEGFLKRVKPEIAIVSCGAWNRYGHPSQAVLDRLRAANVKLYRTDLHGEITITTRGAANDISVNSPPEAGGGWVRNHGRTSFQVTTPAAAITSRSTATAQPQPRVVRPTQNLNPQITQINFSRSQIRARVPTASQLLS